MVFYIDPLSHLLQLLALIDQINFYSKRYISTHFYLLKHCHFIEYPKDFIDWYHKKVKHHHCMPKFINYNFTIARNRPIFLLPNFISTTFSLVSKIVVFDNHSRVRSPELSSTTFSCQTRTALSWPHVAIIEPNY